MCFFLVDLDSRRGEKHVDQLVTQGAYSGVKHFKYMGVSENWGTPKSFISIGFSIILTIYFGGVYHPYFWKHPYDMCLQQIW